MSATTMQTYPLLPGSSHRDPYLVQSIVHSSKLLSAFRTAGETLPLCEIAGRSGLSKTMAFRLLYTLAQCGLVEKMADNQYRSCIYPHKEKLYKFGYAGEGSDNSFSSEISQSLKSAAAAAGIDLICLNNRGNGKITLRNADALIREKVDFAIHFQTDEEVAASISGKYREAGIPTIAIEVPHPGALYYGANNHEAGRSAGRYLGLWAKQHWQDKVEEVVLVELKRAGDVPRMRLSSMRAEMKAVMPQLEKCPVAYLDGAGHFETSFEVMRRHLRETRSQSILVGAINDASALGALRAFQEAGRVETCAVMGQNCSAEGRAEIRRAGTRMVGSVAFFPEKYGCEVLRLALDILNRRQVPPTVFAKHKLITPETVDHYYPYDQLLRSVRMAG